MVAKSFKEIIEKFNPWHDKRGRFTTGGNASFMTIRTKDPSKQKWADMAVARAKEAEKNKKPDFAGQIASVKADSDKIKAQIADLTKQEKECADRIQKLSMEESNLKWRVDDFEFYDKRFDKQKMENFDADAAKKRDAELDAEIEKLQAESDLWYRDRPPRGTPEYDEWRKYRDEHDINDTMNKINAAYEEKEVIRQDVRNYEQYKRHEEGRAEYEQKKARMGEIDSEKEALVTKRLKAQDDIAELTKQNEGNIKKAGAMVADELTKIGARDNTAQVKELEGRKTKLREESSEWDAKYFRGEITGAEYKSYREKALKQLKDLDDEINVLKSGSNNAAALKTTLSKVRSMGVSEEQNANMKTHLPGRSTVKQHVRDAYENYPTEWVEHSMQRSALSTKKVDRGFYSDSRDLIAISGFTNQSRDSTAIHELGHRMERAVPGILQAEQAFYNRRTAGESVQRLKDVTGINYGAKEVTRKDNFLDPYMGKDYGGTSYELVSMGFEMAYKDPKKLAQDPDYQQFIYGLLAIG